MGKLWEIMGNYEMGNYGKLWEIMKWEMGISNKKSKLGKSEKL